MKHRLFILSRLFLFPMLGVLILPVMGGPAHGHGITPAGGVLPKAEKPDPGLFERWLRSFEAEAAMRVRVDEAGGYRYITADGLPDHATGTFPNRRNPNAIKEQAYAFRVSLNPEQTGRVQALGHHPFGIALNGVVFDPLTAEYWNRDRSSGWNIEALSGAIDLGLDDSNAHVQPNGGYHYHGIPTALFNRLVQGAGPVLLGYAADGFPIYGPYDGARASYRVKQGARPSGPGGAYDGTYVQDYEFVAGAGTLDACNGRVGPTPEHPDGTYHYVLTETFPFIPRCYVGTVDDSFVRRAPGGGGGTNAQPVQGQRPGGTPQGGRPDLDAAARSLGVDAGALRRALGPPPPDFARAARELGIREDALRRALSR